MSTTPNPKKGDLTAFADEPEEDLQYLGFNVMTTTGDWLYVDREWLKEQFNKHGLSEHLLPRKVRPWMAYSRMTNELIGPDHDETTVYSEHIGRPLDVQFEIEDGDDKYYHVYAKTFFPEDEVGEDGGMHSTSKLMTLNYLRENEKLLTKPHVDEDDALWDWFKKFNKRARFLFNKHQESHNGQDMRKVINNFILDEANTVNFRNGAYFVGAHHDETITSLAQIWDNLGQFKERGQTPVIYDFPVVDNERYRSQIQRLAEEKIEEKVDKAIEDAFEHLTSEENAETVAESILEEIQDVEDFALEYNQLLEARLSVKDALQKQQESFEDEKEEIIEEALEELEE